MLVSPRYRDSRRALEVVQPLITNFPTLLPAHCLFCAEAKARSRDGESPL